MNLTDKSTTPDDALLKSTLDTTYPFFQQLIELTKTCTREWKFYNGSGWTYKVSAKKKALFYLRPLPGNFNINFALREAEKETLLNSNIATDMREKLLAAEKFPEGFALRLNIKTETEFHQLVALLGTVMEMRG